MKGFTRLVLVIFALFTLAACGTTRGTAGSTQRIKITDSPDGARATLNDSILFAVGSSTLFKETDEIFDALKPALHSTKGKITVEGHTDSTGTSANNVKLSQKRAEAVKVALIERQVNPSRIEVRGYGSSRPVIANAKTQQELAQNRRAVIVFQGETAESLGGNNIEKTLSDISNKISSWLGTVFKRDVATESKE